MILSKNLAQYVNVNRLVFGSLLDRLVSILFFEVVITDKLHVCGIIFQLWGVGTVRKKRLKP